MGPSWFLSICSILFCVKERGWQVGLSDRMEDDEGLHLYSFYYSSLAKHPTTYAWLIVLWWGIWSTGSIDWSVTCCPLTQTVTVSDPLLCVLRTHRSLDYHWTGKTNAVGYEVSSCCIVQVLRVQGPTDLFVHICKAGLPAMQNRQLPWDSWSPAFTVWQLICGNRINCNFVYENMGTHSKASYHLTW